jgi:hypothetical protein
MYFLYHPFRMFVGSLIWIALCGGLLRFVLTHPRHDQSSLLWLQLLLAGLILWAGWTAVVSLRWMWAGVRTYYRAGR